MKKLLLIIYIVCTALFSNAQQTVFEEKRTIYSKENAGGITIHTDGWGVNFYTAKYLTGFTKRLWHFELVSMTSQRQYRINLNRGSYHYGKLNTLTFLRTSWGFQKEFLPRQSVKGISVSYILNAGITHAFIKPVYLIIEYNNEKINDERYDPEKHDRSNIAGKSPFYVGLDELDYQPGLFLRSALNFDWAPKPNMVRALEVGIAADLFAQGIPMMAYEEPKQYFFTAFINIEFGSRKFDGQNKDNADPYE